MHFKPYPADARKLASAARHARRGLPLKLPPLIYLTDPRRSPDPVKTAKSLPFGSAVIYRHFGSDNRIQTAQALRDMTWRSKCLLLIGNDPELAFATKADGVHWSEARLQESTKWLQAFSIMTGAAHSRSALVAGQNHRLNAMLVSTVFPSNSASAAAPMGAIKFRAMAKAALIPIYALGGVSASNADSIAHFGGIAAIEGIERAFVR